MWFYSVVVSMRIINLHEAKTNLSCLVEQAAKGDSFIIAKAGKPLVKVTALGTSEPVQMKRIGFLATNYKYLMISIVWVVMKFRRTLVVNHEITSWLPPLPIP